jgi:hypothetical protein
MMAVLDTLLSADDQVLLSGADDLQIALYTSHITKHFGMEISPLKSKVNGI